jgi:hypothetical protein
MLKAIASGITRVTLLAEKLQIPLPNASRSTKRLRRAGWIRKEGKDFVRTPKAKKLSSKSESQTVSGSAPVKEEQATEPQPASHEQTLENSGISQISPFSQLARNGAQLAEIASSRGAADPKRKRKIEDDPLFCYSPDWRDFLDLATLPRKAGCSPKDLARVVYKEAVDNACDAGTGVNALWWADSKGNIGLSVKDQGPGLDPEQVPIVYSPNRPQLSSKRIRRVQRGILGNGCRVIGGAVAATGGSLMVDTRGHRLTLQMNTTIGRMLVASDEQIPPEPGLTLYVALGPALALREDDFDLAKATILINSQAARLYSGPSSPWWYGPHDLYRLAQEAQGDISFSRLCRKCEFTIAGITEPSWRRPAKEFSFAEIGEALTSLRSRNKPVPPKKLGLLGSHLFAPSSYSKEYGIAKLDGAELPYVLEAYAHCSRPRQKASGELKIELLLNGSKTPAKLYGRSTPQEHSVRGCDLSHHAADPPKVGDYALTLSVITPSLPLVDESKEPSLEHIVGPVLSVVYKAAKKAYRAIELGKPPGAKWTIKSAGFHVMAKAYADASGNGTYPAEGRQVMYSARGEVLRLTGRDKIDGNDFVQRVVRAYVAEHPEATADWDIVFNARGHFSEAHTNYSIGLGTVEVRDYLAAKLKMPPAVRIEEDTMYPTLGPLNRFGAVLFTEKEGFDPLFAAAKISERYDISPMSTKGMSVAAARMLVDWLCARGVKVLVLHDFDITGFKIFGTLGTDSKVYTFKNKVELIDIGLRSRTLVRLSLQSEPVKTEGDWKKHAATLRRHGATKEEIDFLSEKRVELNAMTAPVFVQFLEEKFALHGIKKVVPEGKVLEAQARRCYERKLTEELLEEHRDRLKEEAAAMPIPDDLGTKVVALLGEHPEWPWDKAVTQIAATALQKEESK